MAEKKRTYKCGKCGESGHNARKCPQSEVKKADITVTVDEPVAVEPEVTEEPEAEKVEEAPAGQVALNTNQDISLNYDKEAARPARPPAPFECPTCLRVGILALLELNGGSKVLRCEHCYTQANPIKILKWGALPGDKPADAPGYVGRWGVRSKPADAF